MRSGIHHGNITIVRHPCRLEVIISLCKSGTDRGNDEESTIHNSIATIRLIHLLCSLTKLSIGTHLLKIMSGVASTAIEIR